jgi:peroxiredoxin
MLTRCIAAAALLALSAPALAQSKPQSKQGAAPSATKAPSSGPVEVGQSAHSFKAKLMDGKTVNFPDDYKGKLVLLDFWATWCPPCREELPGLVKAHQKHRPAGLEVLGISLDRPNAESKIRSMMASNKMTYPQVYDGKYWEAAVAVQYEVHSIPAAFLVDGDTGKVLAAGGSLRGDRLGPTITKALAAKAKERKAAKDSDKAKEKPAPGEAKPADDAGKDVQPKKGD